jgi:hypothetical protein
MYRSRLVPGRTAFYQRRAVVVIALAALMQGEIAIWCSKQAGWLGREARLTLRS